MKTRVTTNQGYRIYLYTNDTLTLAFPGMEESTPESLADCVSARSLKRIADKSNDANERSKAARALSVNDC